MAVLIEIKEALLQRCFRAVLIEIKEGATTKVTLGQGQAVFVKKTTRNTKRSDLRAPQQA